MYFGSDTEHLMTILASASIPPCLFEKNLEPQADNSISN